MKLRQLLDDEMSTGLLAGGVEVTGITPDSRKVAPGFVFAALSGSRTDGARYVAQALEKGAAVILAARDAEIYETGNATVVRASDPRRALALMASRFHHGQPETITAVTGTSGKTSVATFVRQIWSKLGHKAASLGTVGLIRPDGRITESLTTPEPVTLHQLLADLAREDVTHLSMEASSHGLEQRRLDGVRLAAGAFTNLGHDHLDYHKDQEDYFNQKKRLFNTLLTEGAGAVVNLDAPRAEEVVEEAYGRGLKVMTVGRKGRGIRLLGLERDGFAQRLSVSHEGESYAIRLPLIGTYQAANALVAAGLCIATGSAPEGVFAKLESLATVLGRLDIVGEARGGLVVVDYAHKPDALEAALDALRPFVTGKLVCVFGCGGDRDRLKRPVMGRIATAKADRVIVTDDNPRTEQAAAIRAEILAGTSGAEEIGDRGEAIRSAIRSIGAGDVILIAGKGHEQGQYIGDAVIPFSDHAAARAALGEIGSDG
ncbi:MAG: UDP-N-acetylmuramoyl-L-alanyl-D-glutamate--2,6-diaminopimelate ligase [Hyphomicrobiaceae bacterium]